MRIKDLHILPKFRDGWSYLYVEHCKVDQEAKAIAINDAEGKVPVPCANLALLMLGPGVSVTHAAISVLADHGCLVAWCGEKGVRFYSVGMGETRSSSNFLHQARMWSDPDLHLKVVYRMYQSRFSEEFEPGLTLQQIRGMEGARVRDAYSKAARETGVRWTGRNYKRDQWNKADPVNRALSTANSCLYGICHAAIVTAGFSPALGFIHTGKMLSFVYDVADLYKADITIPIAFQTASQEPSNLEREVRIACRDQFVTSRILERIVPDLQNILMISQKKHANSSGYDKDMALPGGLWDPDKSAITGGVDYSQLESEIGQQNDGFNS
jgi:CRISPR-associated protein Cas1